MDQAIVLFVEFYMFVFLLLLLFSSCAVRGMAIGFVCLFFNHGDYTLGLLVVIYDPFCNSPQDVFNGVDTAVRVWIPDWTLIF